MQNGQEIVITVGRLWAWVSEKGSGRGVLFRKGWGQSLVWKIAHPTLPRPDKPGSPWQTPGVTERLPGGLMTSTGCLLSAGVVELHTSQAPHGLCPPGSWAMSCLGFQAPTRAELPPTLCQGPHELMCTSGVTCSPRGSPKGNFLKISVLGKIHISDSSFMFGINRK